MSNHDDFQQLLSRDLDGEIAEVERQRLDEHLAECAECRALQGQWKAMRGAFQVDTVRQSSVGLKDRILAHVERETANEASPTEVGARPAAGPRTAVLVGLRRSAAAAAVVLLLLGGLHVASLPDEVRADDPPVEDPTDGDFEVNPEFREIMKDRDPDEDPEGRYLELFVPDER